MLLPWVLLALSDQEPPDQTMPMRKAGGLLFTFEQLEQLAMHLNPDNVKNAGEMGVFHTVNWAARERGTKFISVHLPVKDEPGQTVDRYLFALYARQTDETKAKFLPYRAGPQVADFKKLFAEQGVQGELEFCTLLGV